MKMQSDSTTGAATPQVGERAPAIERARANLKGALRVLSEEPFGTADAVLVEQLINFALADLVEATADENGAGGRITPAPFTLPECRGTPRRY
jgi:hypothetical protein